MTTRSKGISSPSFPSMRLTNGSVEISLTAIFTDTNSAYKHTYSGIQPITSTAPIAAAPQDLVLTSQNSNAGFSARGGSVNLTPGLGSVTEKSGNVVIKDTAGNGGAWDSAHIVLGAYHIWIDGSGKLRIKSSAPTSASDGTVVGTQT